jgi:hypothetical protein
VVRRVGCVAGIGCVAVIPSAGRPGRRGATAECLFAACCVAVRTGWTLLVGYPDSPWSVIASGARVPRGGACGRRVRRKPGWR